MLGNLVLAIAGVAFWVISVAVLRADGQGRQSDEQDLLRHVKYRSFYPAGSAVNAIVPTIKKQQSPSTMPEARIVMLQLRQFRNRSKGLPDLLNYAALVDDGVVLNKDGSLMAAWEYRGEDLESAGYQELAAVSARVNKAFLRRGSGWMIHVDAVRSRPTPTPRRGKFADRTTALIELNGARNTKPKACTSRPRSS